jgi:hypothetical protein
MVIAECRAPTQPLAEGAVLLHVPDDLDRTVTLRRGCVMGAYSDELPLEAIGLTDYGMHVHTVGEELKTMVNRHLKETPSPHTRSRAWRSFKHCLSNVAKQIGTCRKTPIRQIALNKSGRARGRFLQGYYELQREGLKSYHGNVSSMQKQELHPVDKL